MGEQPWGDIPVLPTLRDYSDGLLIVAGDGSSHHGPPVRMELHFFADAEIQHRGVGAHLAENPEARHDFVIELDEFFLGKRVDINVAHMGRVLQSLHVLYRNRAVWQVGTVRETRSKSGALQPRRCYSVIAMAIKKKKPEGAVRKTAEIIEERLGALPLAKAKVMLKDIHKLAVKSSRPADSRNASKSRRSHSPRSLSRVLETPALWTLTNQDAYVFAKALLDPPAPSARMKAAAWRRLALRN